MMNTASMTIGKASQSTGLNVKTIRHLESIGLVMSHRQENGYRVFDRAQVNLLNWIGHAKNVGLSNDECRDLVQCLSPASALVDRQTKAKKLLDVIEEKNYCLSVLRTELSQRYEQARQKRIPENTQPTVMSTHL